MDESGGVARPDVYLLTLDETMPFYEELGKYAHAGSAELAGHPPARPAAPSHAAIHRR